MRHRDVAALAADRRFRGGAHERVLLHSPLAFDATTYELWVPLLSGGQVIVPPSDMDTVDAPVLRELIGEHGLTAMWLTAGLFGVLAQSSPECFAGLREIWTGGEAVPAASVRRVLEACPGLRVVDGYGPTETTTFATSRPMTGNVPDRIPIGSPLDGMRVYVVDANLCLVPPGSPGVHRRRRYGPRLPSAAGVDRGPVRPRSLRPAGGADVPHGRCCALERRR